MTDCYKPQVENHDHAFMGTTHALSALAVFFPLVALVPEHLYAALGTTSIFVAILAAINLVGGCLSVDLDNTASTAKSNLGFLGDILSGIYRAVSQFVQMTIRSSRDDATPDPHRGFFHTIPAAVLCGLLVFFLTGIDAEITKSFGGITIGTVFALVVSAANIHIALAALLTKETKKFKKSAGGLGELAAAIISVVVVLGLFSQVPNDLNFWWLGLSITVGMLIHSFGDCFTTSGAPVLFPIPRKGKLWYNIRFLPIKAGGFVENSVFKPLFLIVIVVSIAYMMWTMVG